MYVACNIGFRFAYLICANQIVVTRFFRFFFLQISTAVFWPYMCKTLLRQDVCTDPIGDIEIQGAFKLMPL